MKEFFKFMFASMVGFILTAIILFFLFMAFVMAMVSFSQPEEVQVKDGTILHLKLNYDISDRTVNNPFQFTGDFESFKPKPGLKEILKNIQKAKTDDRIKGIYLDMSDMPSGLATLTEIREAILDFKSTGKFVYSYGNIYFQKAYYLATAADKVFLNPEGAIEFKGFRGNVVFIKGLLEKLEIEPQVLRHGKFKSAVEPLLLDKMSENNKEQTLAFVQSLWDEAVSNIADSRGLTVEEINFIADQLGAQNPENALKLNIVDSLIYYDEFLSILSERVDVDHIKSDDLLTIAKYNNAAVDNGKKKRSKNKVAVIYASGDIIQGEGSDDQIGAAKISRTIRQARLDESIDAVVLRVNSGGGDGLASDIILREMILTKEEKPVVVSMGNVAASGGYYIACAADKVLANPTTITGSIGVFGLIPNFQGFFNEKMGITFDGVSTNENSEFIQITGPLTEFQKELIQNEVDRFYDTFINHVAKGREMTYEQVDEIAQGRVWSGVDALNNGLIDELGGLDAAVEIAAELAELEDYRTEDYPKVKEPIEQIMEDLFGNTQTRILQNELGENYKYFNYIKQVTEQSGIQARLPYAIDIR